MMTMLELILDWTHEKSPL